MYTVRVGAHRGADSLGELAEGTLDDGRQLLVRTLPVATAAAPAVLERLQAQQKALEPLLGAGVPRLRLCGQLPDGRVYVAVEALRGASLQAAWADEPTAHKLSLLAQVANLLVRAHARGLAHGQLTAEAVWVVPPRPRHLPKAVVLDLGVRAALAKEATADLPQHDLRAFADLVQTLLMGPDADAAARPHGAVGQELEALLAHCHRPGVAAADMLPTLTSALQCAAEGVMDTDMRPVAMAAANLTLSPPGGSPAATDPLMGIQIGNWLLTRKLGQGGMGAVYEAVHHQIHRLAAVKVMHPYLAHNPQYATRFLNEARAVNLAPHPDLVEIIDFNRTEEGLLYLVMELLHGETLRAHLERKRSGLPLPEALSITLQLARALADVHKRGIVHRDR
jgi:serine/threonine protein kinase